MTRYLIVREADDTPMRVYHGTDTDAEQWAAELSETKGPVLVFRDQKIMAHARDGEVYSYRPEAMPNDDWSKAAELRRAV